MLQDDDWAAGWALCDELWFRAGRLALVDWTGDVDKDKSRASEHAEQAERINGWQAADKSETVPRASRA